MQIWFFTRFFLAGGGHIRESGTAVLRLRLKPHYLENFQNVRQRTPERVGKTKIDAVYEIAHFTTCSTGDLIALNEDFQFLDLNEMKHAKYLDVGRKTVRFK